MNTEETWEQKGGEPDDAEPGGGPGGDGSPAPEPQQEIMEEEEEVPMPKVAPPPPDAPKKEHVNVVFIGHVGELAPPTLPSWPRGGPSVALSRTSVRLRMAERWGVAACNGCMCIWAFAFVTSFPSSLTPPSDLLIFSLSQTPGSQQSGARSCEYCTVFLRSMEFDFSNFQIWIEK